jgi:hypothetical protein
MLYNNIDPKKPIELDAKMFLFDTPVKSDNGKMWICTNIKYSEEVLMTKTHFECVQTFFDQALFLKYIKESSVKKPNNDPAVVGKIGDEKWADSEGDSKCKSKHLCFMKENTLLALKYCFPVTFPVDSPPYSFSKGQQESITISKYINSWFNSDKYAYFTHMKVDGKDMSVINCQWLDTIKFHPVYQKVNKGIKQYLVQVKAPLIKLLKNVIENMNATLPLEGNPVLNDYYEAFLKSEFGTFGKSPLPGFFQDSNIISSNFPNLFKNTLTEIENNGLTEKIIYNLFFYMYNFYYYPFYVKKDVSSETQLYKEITEKRKTLKQFLDLILLLCSVHSKEGYNQFVTLIKMDQVTLQKYDFHKPYVQLFESVTIPIRRSTNAKIKPTPSRVSPRQT